VGVASRDVAAWQVGVQDGVTAIHHRGPDSSGTWMSPGDGPGAALGSVRLRIIDLSPEGDQPMSNEDATVWVSFNGELYNHTELRLWLVGAGHTFRSHTDTETLVHAYEEHADDPTRFLERLRGMFAFAIYDTARSRLLLVRDRLGIKPLYLTNLADGGIAFGSEIRAVARAAGQTPAPDLDSFRSYLLRGVIPGPGTAFAGVRELPAGSMLTWEAGRPVDERRWWRPSFVVDDAMRGISAPEAADVLRPVLRDAVERHLVSDRPVGLFLSSGVDSGALATIASELGTARTFTVTFPDLGSDEGPAAMQLALLLGTEHTEVAVTAEEAGRLVPGILADMDQPTHDGVNAWLVCRAAREAGLVVALSGLGGDELFGGYHTFDMVPRVAKLRALLSVMPKSVRLRLARAAAARTPGGRSARVWAADTGQLGAYRAVRGLFSSVEFDSRPSGLPIEEQLDLAGLSPKDMVSLFEMTYYLADQTLRDTDQMSMAHSLEVRVPLLDDDLVRTACAIPADVRTEAGKALLVRSSGLQQVHAKRPFALPFDRWIQGPLHGMVREGLLSEELPFADLMPRPLRQRLWSTLGSGRVHWSRPWAVAVARLWPGANGLDW